MRILSWLFGSLSVAFLVAGCLLFLQPTTAHAATVPCGNCTSQCTFHGQADCNGSTLCPGNEQNQCTKTFGSCECSFFNTTVMECQCN